VNLAFNFIKNKNKNMQAICTSFVFVSIIISFVSQTVKQKVKNKKWPARNFKIFKFYLCHSRESFFFCTRLYFKGFGDTAILKFRKCAKRGSQPFLKISKWINGIRKEIVCIFLFVVSPISISLKMTDFLSWCIFEILK